MSQEDAVRKLEGTPAVGTMSAEGMAAYLEARMVDDGRSADDIRAVVEKFLGRPLD